VSDWQLNPEDFAVSDMLEKGRRLAMERAVRDRDDKVRQIEADLGRPIRIVRSEMVPTATGFDFKYWYVPA
jgi:hypothetical protein